MDNNMEMTLLSYTGIFKEENGIISDKYKDIFKKVGAKSAASDLSLVNGSFVVEDEYANNNHNLSNRSTSYFVKENYGAYNFLITLEGTTNWTDENAHNIGIRPVIEFKDFPIELLERIFVINGIPYVYFGEYPQVAVKNQRIIKYHLSTNKVQYTGKEYRIKPFWYSNMLSYIGYKEFEYNNEKYIKTKVDIEKFYYVILSNGKKYRQDDTAILKVTPILWIVDYPSKRLISNNVITSGIRFNNQRRKPDDFTETEMYNYLNNYMINDMIINSRDYENINKKIRIK